MLTDQLRESMLRATNDQPYVPGLAPALHRARTVRRRRHGLAAVSSIAVVAIIAGGTLAIMNRSPRHVTATPSVPTVGLGGRPPLLTGPEFVRAYSKWGPTRGDLAHDGAFRQAVISAWTSHHDDAALPGVSTNRQLAGKPQVLFAGTTPDGPMALVEQLSSNRAVGLYLGVVEGTSGPRAEAQLDAELFHDQEVTPAARRNLTWFPGNENTNVSLDPYGASFVTGHGGRYVVTLPVDAQANVAISTGHILGENSVVRRTWRPVRQRNGVGISLLPTPGSAIDTLVRIDQEGRSVDEQPVLTTSRTPRVSETPSNLLPTFWISGPPGPTGRVCGKDCGESTVDDVAGNRRLADGIPLNSYYAWVRTAFGTTSAPYPSEPYGVSGWQVSGSLRDGYSVEAQQEWLFGDSAHTVVDLVRGGHTQVISDVVTDTSARPLVATRLPFALGWLVIGGPHSTVTGYRTSGATSWTVPRAAITGDIDGHRPHTHRAVVLPTGSASIQVRLQVGGQERVVTETD
jgi:hypothetical protein